MDWRPTTKQEEALLLFQEDDVFEILYGGARGGGKTTAGIAVELYRKDNSRHRALVIRKQAEDLKDWVDRANMFYRPFGAELKGMPGDFYWPSGAILRTGHLKTENAYTKYVGHEYDLMIIEELNLIPAEDNYLKLISSCRSVHKDLRPKVFATCNPSDEGFSWIKKRWEIPGGIPTKPIISIDKMTGLKRVFIPARLDDNPFLAIDDQYKKSLAGLPDGLREAWLLGSWDEPIIKGAYYAQELAQMKREGRIRLVPFDPQLKVHTIWDLGIGKAQGEAMVILFVQRTKFETRIINYYQNEGYGLDHYQSYLTERARQERYSYGKHFVPHDAAKQEIGTGQTIWEMGRKVGIKWEAPLPRIDIGDGIQKVRLMFPKLYINELYCQQLIDALRNYRKVWDENLLKYKDEPLKDWTNHAADAVRYLSMVEEKLINEDDDFQFPQKEIRTDPYA